MNGVRKRLRRKILGKFAGRVLSVDNAERSGQRKAPRSKRTVAD